MPGRSDPASIPRSCLGLILRGGMRGNGNGGSARLGGHAWPVVGAERGGRQSFAAVEVADGVVGPGVTDGDGVGDLVRPDLDLVLADDLGVGPDELVVAAGDGEPARSRRRRTP